MLRKFISILSVVLFVGFIALQGFSYAQQEESLLEEPAWMDEVIVSDDSAHGEEVAQRGIASEALAPARTDELTDEDAADLVEYIEE